jgi:rRNA-processing protein EBP2
MAKKSTTQSPKAGSKPKLQAINGKLVDKKKDSNRRKSAEEPTVEQMDLDKKEESEDKDSSSDGEEEVVKANGSGNAKKDKAGNDSSSDEDSEDTDDDSDSSDESGEDRPSHHIDIEAIDDSESESELDSDGEDAGAKFDQKDDNKDDTKKENEKEGDEDEEDDDEEEEIDVEELEPEDEEDEEQIAAGTRVRQTINNKEALLTSLRRFALETDPKKVPFAFHQTVVSSKRTEDSIPSVEDDLQRELAFVNQALEAARLGRALLRKEGVPFTRPTDYFAETVRSDETMQKVRAKLVEEATAKKAAAEARKQRDLKKFGKQVQVQKQLERAKQKREALEKINMLKKSAFFWPFP